MAHVVEAETSGLFKGPFDDMTDSRLKASARMVSGVLDTPCIGLRGLKTIQFMTNVGT